jgi:acyl-CoA thioester hydrolase
VRTYFEVRNPAKGEIAASFIIEFALLAQATRGRLALSEDTQAAARAARIDLPAHGAPRTIPQARPNLLVTMAQIAARVGERSGDGMMGGVMERLVEAEDCDADGFLKEGEDMMFGARIRAQFMQGKTFGPPTFVSDEGHRFGWATLEARLVQLQVPRAGDLLRSFGADVGIERKTRHTRRWIFNTATGVLAGVDDIVGIALDLDARRSIEIPASVREALQGGFVPEFA